MKTAPTAHQRASRSSPGTLLHLTLVLAGLWMPALPALAGDAPPPLMLANAYRAGLPVSDYWVSEKYDGIRGYWDGSRLLTRGGERIVAPDWFTAGWPKTPMDGELWAGRGQFSKAVSTVRQQRPDDDAWRAMRFMVFDLPAHPGTFNERIPAVNGVVIQIDQPWVQAVVQSRVGSAQALNTQLTTIVRQGGEGLMLHRGSSLYQGLRTDDLIKMKLHEDAEARVVGYVPGKGKYAGQVGALLVETPGTQGKPGQRFKLGSGLNDSLRREPPPIGSVVTYRFRGTTEGGVPRFATFVRQREDSTL